MAAELGMMEGGGQWTDCVNLSTLCCLSLLLSLAKIAQVFS